MYIKAQDLAGWWMVSLLSVASFAASTSDLDLPRAAKNQDKDAVRALLKQRADVNTPQGDGSTALHWAAHWDDRDTAGLLLGAGANVNAANDLGVTPLYLACANGSAAMVQTLLAAGANPNAAAATGVSPLMQAARSGSADAVQALLARGANMDATENSAGQTALMWAAAQRHPEVVRVLVMHGVDVRVRSRTSGVLVNINAGGRGLGAHGPAKVVQTGGSTAMLFAARVGCAECARALLAGGANANDSAPDGNSALVLAAHSGQGAFAAFLLDKDADPNAHGAGYTALHAAVLRGDLDLVKALVAHGANPNARLESGTPLRREGPDYALPESLAGATAFLLAAKYADVDMMRVLSAGGADVKLVAKDGSTPLIAAASADRRPGGNSGGVMEEESHAREAVKLVLDLGCDVNAANQAGNTALYLAASRGYNTVVQLLADKGAKLDVKNKRGVTPLAATLVTRKGDEGGQPRLKSTADLLRKLGATE
jgi:ankyrin repeat protein